MVCENCGGSEIMFRRCTDHHGELPFCSTKCANETNEFYASGRYGIYGCTTKEAEKRLAERGVACFCWTTEENRIRSVVHRESIVHSSDCPNRELESVN